MGLVVTVPIETGAGVHRAGETRCYLFLGELMHPFSDVDLPKLMNRLRQPADEAIAAGIVTRAVPWPQKSQGARRLPDAGWLTGLEPATARITTWCSTN